MTVTLLSYNDIGNAAVDKINAAIQALNAVTDTSVPQILATLASFNIDIGQLQTFAAATNTNIAAIFTDVGQLQAAASFIDGENADRASDIRALQTSEASLASTVAANGTVLIGRPGDAPQLYAASVVGGDPSGLDAAPGPVVTVDTGFALQLAGIGYVAPRATVAVTPNRTYRVRWAARRTTDTSDPAGATVQFGVAWYDKSRSALSVSAPFALPLTVARGRVEALTVFALAGSTFTDLVAPAGACFARPFVQTFGADQVSAVEELSIADISDAGLIAPDVDSLAARLAAVEAKLGITGVAA